MDSIKRLFDIPYYQLHHFPNADALVNKVNGKWIKTSTADWIEQANAVSRGLIELGIQPNDKIALISNNRAEWNICDTGILQIGAQNVPIYPTISEDDFAYIFNDASVKLCIVSDEELYKKVMSIKDKVPSLEKTFTFNEVQGAPHWSAIKDAGKSEHQEEVEKRKAAVNYEDLATLIYTSGTTGLPKGVMLSHQNIVSNCVDSTPKVPVGKQDKALSFLPVCHIFERMVLYLYFYNGVSVYFAESLDTIGDNMREVKPHVFTAVPRLLEKVFEKIISKGSELTGIKRVLFFWAVGLAEQWEPYERNGAFYEFKLKIARKLIFSKWKEALGGDIKTVVSGSAALQPRLARIFNGAGIPVWEGYGLTETSPVISVNHPEGHGFEIGCVGRTIDNVEVRIDEDGEILVKGPNVMMGYYNQPEKTKEVFTDDGFFKTGDIGIFTETGLLKITDRKKEIFKTSGGKYVAPQPIENKLKESRFIEQAMIIGEGRKFPAVLIVPAWAFVKDWCELHDVTIGSIEDMCKNEAITNRIWQEVESLTKHLGKWEQPKKMFVCTEEWSVDSGELTPTMKLKRKPILAKYTSVIDDLYQ